MPSSIVHNYFTQDLINNINNKNDKIDKSKLCYFAQSTDPFHFYHILKPWKINGKKIRKFTETFHTTNCGIFLIKLTKEIKEKNLKNNKEILSFLYGFTAHYILDSTIHPYVIYKTGKFIPSIKETHKYNAKHNELEVYLDKYLYEKRENKKIKNYKAYKDLFQIKPFSNDLIELLDPLIEEIYNVKDFHKIYYQSLKDMKFVFHYLRYDPLGILEKSYYIFDKIMPSSILNAKFLSYHYVPKNAYKWLNNNHKIWYYSMNPSKKFHYSFDELYDIALKKGNLVLQEIDAYLFQNKKVELEKIIKNISYTTGIDENIKQENPKYEF